MRNVLLLSCGLLAGCVSAGSKPDLARAAPVFDAVAFFSGHTEGQATLHVLFSGQQAVHVQGTGRVEAHGTLVLDQQVQRGQDKATTRQWRLHAEAPGRYTGTLTDANGPVSAEADGNTLHIRFPEAGGMRVEQWLYLQPGGQVALNRLTIRKYGVAVAGLEETIRRVP